MSPQTRTYTNLPYRWIRTALALAAATTAAVSPMVSMAAIAVDKPVPSRIVISEVQTGGCTLTGQSGCVEDTKAEFVELYNQSADTMDITGWQVRYVPAAGSSSKPVDLGVFDGVLSGHDFVLLTYPGYLADRSDIDFTTANSSGSLAKTGGHIQLLDASGVVADKIGWGSATEPYVKSVPAPIAGSSLARTKASGGLFVDSRNNAADFATTSKPDPLGGGYTPTPPAPTPAPDTLPDTQQPTLPVEPQPTQSGCSGVIINEVLPDPAGADAEGEFIELRNATTSSASLAGCELQTSANSKSFALPAINLDAGAYYLVSAADSGLTLANSSGGSVYLLFDEVEMNAATYPADMPEDSSWAYVDGNWARTYQPTPGAPNLLVATEPCPSGQERNLATNRCVTLGETATPVANSTVASAAAQTPCKPGQERNPDTNRCRTASTTSANELSACKVGQTRNPATNRCAATANIATAGTTQACKPGQERNPETNRCRTVATTAAAKTCPAGQERNAETNRCRKISSAAVGATSTKVEDVKSPIGLDSNRWLLAGLAVAGALAYGIYEWRQEIAFKLRGLASRFGFGQARRA